MGNLNIVSNAFCVAGIMIWDVFLTLGNLVRFSLLVGEVTPIGHPGYGGYWPEYRPPRKGDSRCSCPGLNTMANHGILARSGRGIKFTDLTYQIRTTYNFAPSFCAFVPRFAARMLLKNYSEDTFDLEELDLYNGIQHDASLTRLDMALQPDQSVKHHAFIEELFSFATGKDADGKPLFTKKDLSRILGKRRAEARATNKQYTLGLVHKLFGSSNSSTMLTIFGGRVEDLRIVLLEECLPEGWESRIRQPYGLTMTQLNCIVFPVEFGIREADWVVDADPLAESHAGQAVAVADDGVL